MTDKKNIVIRVKYPVSGNAAESSPPKIITVWNIKRILLAAGALVLVLTALFYVVNDDMQQTNSDNAAVVVNAAEKQASPQPEDKEADIKNLSLPGKVVTEINFPVKPKKEPHKINKQTAGIAVKGVIKKQPNKETIKESERSYTLLRSLLTYDIKNKEPTGEITRTVTVSKKKPTWVYYFTELKAMKGSKVYHEWLKNGVIVSRQALLISGDTWRTSSRRLLSDSEKAKWTVKLVDEKGRLLDEKSFKVE